MIVSLRRLGEPRTNREIFRKLAQDGWITVTDGEAWWGIVSLRNIVVHRYLDVDPIIVRDSLLGRGSQWGVWRSVPEPRLAFSSAMLTPAPSLLTPAPTTR